MDDRPSSDSRQVFFCLRHRVQGELRVPTSVLSSGYCGVSPGVRRPGREADSPPSSSEVKNEWSYISTPPICLLGMMLN
jgi:hypothetical protein